MIKKRILFWLIALWILVPSFSNAYNVIGDWWQYEVTPPDTVVVWNNVYIFSSNWIINTQDYWRFLYWQNSNNTHVYNYVYGWVDWQLYFAWLDNWVMIHQGFVETFCKTQNPTSCNTYNVSASDVYSLGINVTKVVVWNPGTTSPSWAYWNRPFMLCYYNSSDWFYYCSQEAINNENYWYSSLTWSLWFTTVDTIKNYSWGPSAFIPAFPDTDVPDYDTDPGNFTNCEILSWYNVMWLTDEFCFWWFAIDDIFQSWEIPSKFVWYRWGSGVNILDLWDLYSWAYNNDPV